MSYRIRTDKTWPQTHRELGVEFQRWANAKGRRCDWKAHYVRGEPGVTLVYQFDGEPEVRLEMEAQARAEDNLRVLYLAVEALRLNDLRGIADVVRAAYLALPAPAIERDPYEVLGVRSDTPVVVIQGAYRALAKLYHPDNGDEPDAARMAEVNAAWERVKGDAK